MARALFVTVALCACATALQPLRAASSFRKTTAMRAGNQVDPSSPEMLAEFENLKDYPMSAIMNELEELGIPTSPDMGEMEIRVRLMEARVIMAKPSSAAPPAGCSAYETLIFEKPGIKTYVDGLYNKGGINEANAFMEYVNDAAQATIRYGKVEAYREVFAKAEEMMSAPAFTSSKLSFGGFPMMGEDALRGQMETCGAVKAFSVSEEDPVTGMKGSVEFEDEESAKTAVEKWDGADMGNEVSLSLKYL